MKASCALISVSDKAGVIDFARGLHKLGIKIISTGGTGKALTDAGIPTTNVSDYTGFPEILDGRVKTLHPKVEAGILAVRANKQHMTKLEQHNIDAIDIVAVNLYPFQQTISKEGVTLDQAIENIDVGGPTMLRAAAKNYEGVTVITDPADYPVVLGELTSTDNEVSVQTRRRLAVKAFAHTAEYDSIIHTYLVQEFEPDSFPAQMNIILKKAYDLRYGENPHQRAAFYFEKSSECSVTGAKILSEGKKLSFNNLIDANAALELVKEFDQPAAVVIKHLNPAGVGVADDINTAYNLAHNADPLSAYGCVVALNRQLDERIAKDITSTFVELVAAPSYTGKALDALLKKEKMRVLDVGELTNTTVDALAYRSVVGGMIVQTPDLAKLSESDLKTVSKRKPTTDEIEAMLFAWKVCKHTKSNSIVLAQKDHTVGVGAGQMSRVDAVRIAAMKAKDLAKGSVMASDAFFPFRDGIDAAAKAGVTAVIHPGGSIRDEDVIKAANEHEMALVHTGVRCFLH